MIQENIQNVSVNKYDFVSLKNNLSKVSLSEFGVNNLHGYLLNNYKFDSVSLKKNLSKVSLSKFGVNNLPEYLLNNYTFSFTNRLDEGLIIHRWVSVYEGSVCKRNSAYELSMVRRRGYLTHQNNNSCIQVSLPNCEDSY